MRSPMPISLSAVWLETAVFFTILLWWSPWEVPAFHGRYLALKLLLLRVHVLQTYYLGLLRLKYALQLFMLYAKWWKPLLHLRYLLFKRFISHKLKGRAPVPASKRNE